MKKQLFTFVLMLLPMIANAHDLAVKNDDGVMIGYNYINYYTELEVTYLGDSPGESYRYVQSLEIPSQVTYNNETYRVTRLGDRSFFKSFMIFVTIPNSVTSIGDEAFYGCSVLTSITIPNSVTSIGNSAFSGCSGLTSVTFHCKEIGRWFDGNKSIKEVVIGDEVTSIGDDAFSGCSGLTSITIPNSVTSIGSGAFEGTAWFNNQPDGLVYAGKVVYQYKGEMPSNTSIIIKDGTLGIGYGAFYDCSGLTSITIPNSVTSIGYGAFAYCSGLTSITIPNSVTSIGEDAFQDCSGLTSITIGNSVTSIGSGAFYRCSGLTSITIPNSVTSIGVFAFYGCSSLPSITIGNSVTSIGDSAFSGCSGLTSIKVENGNSKFDSRNNCNAIIETATNTLIQGCKNTIIPNSVTSIGSDAFSGCSVLTSITIPNSVTSIGEGAFSGCSGLTSVTIPNSVTSIGGWAFYGCSGLQSVYSKIENVFAINGNTFPTDTYSKAKLYVPIGKKFAYKETEGWKQFNNIEEYDYSTGIVAPQQSKGAKVVDVYQLNGQKRNGMQRGLNIVRMSDGTTKKVVNK